MPFWSSEKLRQELTGLVHPYRPAGVVNASYELRLGSEVFVTGEDTKTRVLAANEQVRIPPGQFANLLTMERVMIPNSALGLISVRFKWKQRGLINVSGFHVDPGYSGRLLFSVYNAGPSTVVISEADPVFLLWIADLDQPTTDVYAKPPRWRITSADVDALQGEIASPEALAARVADLERILNIWSWFVKVVGAAIIAAIVGLVFSWASGDDKADAPVDPTTTSSTSTTSTTAGSSTTSTTAPSATSSSTDPPTTAATTTSAP